MQEQPPLLAIGIDCFFEYSRTWAGLPLADAAAF
jgi:hypothetical protein